MILNFYLITYSGLFFSYSKKIMLAVENYSPPDGEIQPKVIVYDVEYDSSYILNLQLRFIKNLKGISQISSNNKLYLCGASEDNNMGGSFLLCFDPMRCTTTPLVNSIYHHYYPTLSVFNETNLVALSGKNSTKCEIFNTETNKWKYLPDLPECRYGSSAYVDEENEYLYLFGGYDSNKINVLELNENEQIIRDSNNIKELDSYRNSILNTYKELKMNNTNETEYKETSESNNRNNNKQSKIQSLTNHQKLTIYRIYLGSCLSWEPIQINISSTSSELLNKNFSILMRSRNSFFIFGGRTLELKEEEYSNDYDNKNKNNYTELIKETNDGRVERSEKKTYYEKPSNEVIELNLEETSFRSKLHLPKPLSFFKCRDSVNLNKGVFFCLEDDMKAIKLEINGFKLLESQLFNK